MSDLAPLLQRFFTDKLDGLLDAKGVACVPGSAFGEPRALRVEPRIASNNQLSIQQMCEAGLGLALVGSMDSHDALQAGRLVRLLPEWSFGTLDIWAVTPQRDAQPAKVRQAIAALHAYLKQVPGISD